MSDEKRWTPTDEDPEAISEAVEALQRLVAYGQLLRLTDPGVAASVDSDPAWTKAREALRGLGIEEKQ